MLTTPTLTERRIKAALAAGVARRHVLWSGDIPGFGLKLWPSGSASWIYLYRPKGARRGTPASTLTLGGWPAVSLADARVAARIYAGKIAMGADPAAERRRQRAEPRRLLGKALDDYDAYLHRRRLVKAEMTLSVLGRGLAPYLTRDIESLSRTLLVLAIEALEADGKPGAADALRKAARSFLEWAVTRGLVAFNPLAGLRRPKSSRAERLDGDTRKGPALEDAEIRAVWIAASRLGAFGGLVKLGLLSAMRRNELAALKWSDIESDRIVLYPTATKTGVRHEIPLTSTMRSVLADQPRTTSPLVFPPSRRGVAQLAGWTALLATIVKASGVRFRLHDLRRTTRTLMSRLGVAEPVAEAAIGHVKGGLSGIYDLHDFWPERVVAFNKVSAHISALLAAERPPIGHRLDQDIHLPAERSRVASGVDLVGS